MVKKRIHVGTSGWTYSDWNGLFYPADVGDAERLSYYAERFDTVEVNATFYRFPFPNMIVGWNRRLGPAFHFVVKGNRRITHLKKLGDCDDLLQAFLDRVAPLKTLRVILWQLPPSLHQDVGRLEAFLKKLPATVRHAFEFRHASWWESKTATVLARHRAAFVAVSHPRLPAEVIPTSDFLYLRFHGLGQQLYRYDYSGAELADWAERIRPHLRGRELYAFFNNDYQAKAIANAQAFQNLLMSTTAQS